MCTYFKAGNTWTQSSSSVPIVAGSVSRAEEQIQDGSNIYRLWFLNLAPKGVFRHLGLILQDKPQSGLVYRNAPAWATNTHQQPEIIGLHHTGSRSILCRTGHLKKCCLILKNLNPTDCTDMESPRENGGGCKPNPSSP